jgi:exodeoxyribonuclease VII small subunit
MSDQMTFEQARDELERIVRKLEDGQTSLDEALALWERGEQLHELCRAKLDQAEDRVSALLTRMAEARKGPAAT